MNEFVQVDVFAAQPYGGNPLAVFPDASHLSGEQMQEVASEMNLSETTFVTAIDGSAYDVRIFTPREELPFAGHPTLGTTFALRALGLLSGDRATQRSSAGETAVTIDEDRVTFTRTGGVESDQEDVAAIAESLGVTKVAIGCETDPLGQRGWLNPAFSNAGIRQLMVPLANSDVVRRLRPRAVELAELSDLGLYCFTVRDDGTIHARGLFPALGVDEDPATGSAAAGLGLYLADRVGPVEAEIRQGVEIGRPSQLFVEATDGEVRVGGRCELILRGRLEALP